MPKHHLAITMPIAHASLLCLYGASCQKIPPRKQASDDQYFALYCLRSQLARDALQLTVHPEDQQRFIADYVPIAAIALAKAFIRPGGLVWEPYAIYADRALVGFVELAYTRNSRACYWIYHFFIDYIHQGKGYGTRALQQLITLVTVCNPDCQQTADGSPRNHRAQLVYTRKLAFIQRAKHKMASQYTCSKCGNA